MYVRVCVYSDIYSNLLIGSFMTYTQSAGAVEYTDYFSAEG